MSQSQRDRFLGLVLSQYGQPYQWGGVGQTVRAGLEGERAMRVFDCSGLVKWALLMSAASVRTALDWRADVNTDGLLVRCRKTSNPVPGTLVLYGPGATDMEHVMVYLTGGLVFGACGGGRSTRTLEDARRANARVQDRPGVDYRTGRRFFVELPFADEQDGGAHVA